MLVLSRQINESIMIGDSIEVTIVDIKGDKVRIGITAPKSISVHRKEVYLAIQQENMAAAQAADVSTLTDVGALFGPQPAPPQGTAAPAQASPAAPERKPEHGHGPSGGNAKGGEGNKPRGKKKP